MTTRREAREARASAAAPQPTTADSSPAPADRHEDAPRAAKRPLLRRPAFWVPVSLVLVVLAVGTVGGLTAKQLYDDAMSAKSDLERALPLVEKVQTSMLSGDSAAAKATADQIAELTASAAQKTSGDLWRSAEWIPVAGPNLAAVRVAAASADALVHDAVVPLTSLGLDALLPQNGAINIAGLNDLATIVESATATVASVRSDLDAIDRAPLIDQVAGAVTKLEAGLDKIDPYLEPVSNVLAILPRALGSDGPRNYLLLFQNNAESRGTGGNPAAIAVLTATGGAISLTGQASSADFNNGRSEPITPLNPETVAIYGDKIGRFVQDVTLSPDFTESAQIVRAFWAESFGTPVDGVASFDPVALSYLLQATGPVLLPTGETLTAENAVPMLLSDVYSMYPDPEMQDLFFAGAAGAVFSALLQNSPDPRMLIQMLVKAADEGRLLYAPGDPAEAELIAGTEVAGQLPADNAESTVLGAYINDITEGKLDYYLQLDLTAQCSAVEPTGYTIAATLTNTLTPEQAQDLAVYVAPGRFFPKGDISTDLVLYGPVGSQFVSATFDGAPASVTPMPHLGRTAVKVNVLTQPGVAHSVSATFAKPEGATGPVEVRHTPMVRATPVTITECG
ncbi:DUF4012 domain-containing protein [Microbacterium keratanolyticum]